MTRIATLCAAAGVMASALVLPANAQERQRDARANDTVQLLPQSTHRFDQPRSASPARVGGGAVLNERFNNPTFAFPPEGWARINEDGDSQQWIPVTSAGDTLAYSRYSAGAAINGEDYLATPLLAPTTGMSTLSFNAAQQYTQAYNSVYSVLVSNASTGGTQTNPADYAVLASYTEADFPIGAAAMSTFDIDLSSFVGSEIYVAFLHENADGDSFFLDDVRGIPLVVAADTPECPAYVYPGDGDTDVPYGTLTFDWTAATTGAAASGYTLELGFDADLGFDFDAGADTEITLIDLPVATELFYRVTPRNGAGETGSCPIFSFTTAGPTDTFPYEETFDRGGDAPPLWIAPFANGQSWEFVQSITYGADNDHTTGAGFFAAVDDSTPEAANTELVSPVFDLSSLDVARVSFWYQNADIDETQPNPPAALNVDVSYDGGDTYTNDVLVVTGTFTEWTQRSSCSTPRPTFRRSASGSAQTRAPTSGATSRWTTSW